MKAITRVRIKHGGEPLHGRVLSVSGTAGDFQTPQRAPTSTEVNAKIRTHIDDPWDNPIFEITNRFSDTDQVGALHQKNGAFARKRRAVTAQADKFRGYALTKYYPQFPQDVSLGERDIRALVDLQLEAAVDVATIPEPSAECTPERFEKNFERYWSYITDTSRNVAVMPYVSLNQNHTRFEKKLNIILQHEHDIWALGIRFASLQEYRPNLMSLAELGGHDLWIHCSAGKRFPNWRQPVGQLHALQRFGIDTVAVEVPQPPIFSKSKTKDVRYFDRTSITYPTIGEITARTGNLPCGCPVCGESDPETFIEQVRAWGPRDELVLRVNDASKVHEVFASTDEFRNTQTLIKDDTLRDYFRKKAGLKDFLIGEGQRRLF